MKDGGPAFPNPQPLVSSGMSLRDYFAAAAIGPVLGLASKTSSPEWADGKKMARCCYEMADAMLAQRDKP